MHFSLFYFADGQGHGPDQYRLLLEGARFADRHGFCAVWTPERHFHEFGGLYPNPAVTGAALATITERVAIRAGSVVGPLHHPVRIAEEWSVVDHLSGGRVGLAFASGWHANDFVLRPENYPDRKRVVMETIDTVRRLWRGESVELPDGEGTPVPVRVFPAPLQPELPVWLTSAGSADTFRRAGERGLGVLTHLLGQDLDDLAKKLATYRNGLPDGVDGQVALMLHTFLGTDRETVRTMVRGPLTDYIRSSIDLIMKAAGDILPGVDPEELDDDDMEFLVERSFDRYFEAGGLFGTVEDGLLTLERLAGLGVDEVACLIDFGVDSDEVLAALDHLARLKDAWAVREAGS